MQSRCGQCGRSYTKARWRRMAFWCSCCQKYVCSECLTAGQKCPACGLKVDRNADAMLFLGLAFAVGFTLMFILPIILGTKIPIFHPFLIGFDAFVISSFFVGMAGFFQSRRQGQKHMAMLLTLPDGTIPPEKRSRLKNAPAEVQPVDRSRRLVYPQIKGAFQDQLLDGLNGRWDFPVISQEERIAGSAIVGKRMSKEAYILFVIGILILIPCILWSLPYEVWIVPVVLFFFGGLIFGVLYHSRKLVQNADLIAQTKVAWKTIGFEATANALEGFLRQFPKITREKPKTR
jgi:hypothetical protein